MTSAQVWMPEFTQSYRYQIKQKFFTIGNNFKIKDEFGCNKYTVRSKPRSIGKKLTFEDINGSPLLKIHQKGFHFLDQFIILSTSDNQDEQQVASIRQKFTFLKHSYKIYSIYGEYKLKGLNMFDHTFALKNKYGTTVATIHKKLFSMADTYEINIIKTSSDKQEEHVFILALIIVLHCSLYGS